MKTLSTISLYTGAGGLDYGFEAAGFETAVAVEMDPVCCHTLTLNRRWPVLERDIHDISSGEILTAAGLSVGEPDVLIGGPPCQPFSKAGYWKRGDARRLDDPRSGTLEQYLRVLGDTRPRAFLLENVPGLGFAGKNEGLEFLLEGIDEVNRKTGTDYSPYWAKLNAAAFGVPQVRERVFIVGARDGGSFRFPDITHGPQDDGAVGVGMLEPYHTAWDALGDLPGEFDDPTLAPRGKWAALLPTIPEGQNYLWHTARGTERGKGKPIFGWRSRYWSFLLKLAKDRPSRTIQAQPGPAIGPFHWCSRRLSPTELCRLQTFPGGIQFDSGLVDIQKMLGNAVPSLMAEVLAREMRSQLLKDPVRERALVLMPTRRLPVPAEEPYVRRLPARYWSLVGDHPDHPGKGRGPGALRMAPASS